jgi:predicted GIY-YIG superfamily endonuclease
MLNTVIIKQFDRWYMGSHTDVQQKYFTHCQKYAKSAYESTDNFLLYKFYCAWN